MSNEEGNSEEGKNEEGRKGRNIKKEGKTYHHYQAIIIIIL